MHANWPLIGGWKVVRQKRAGQIEELNLHAPLDFKGALFKEEDPCAQS
jgi:hypothetical protein